MGEGGSANFVGYMTDYSASVSLFRTNSPVALSSTCVPLMASDVIVLGEAGGSATVLLPSKAYVISRKGTYHVRASELQLTEEGRDAAITPALGARGDSAPAQAQERMVMPPRELFASVKPPVMRAVGRIDVLSPLGKTHGTTPRLVWKGDPSARFRVQVVGVAKDLAAAEYPVIDVKGCVVEWADTGWPPLTRGASYRIKIWGGDTLLTDETQGFRVADVQQADVFDDWLEAIANNLPAGVGRDLAIASLLANPEHGYFAEARLIAVRLHLNDPGNPVYLHLMRHCYAGMGLAEGLAEVERRLSRLE
jgi:hypothetical protein